MAISMENLLTDSDASAYYTTARMSYFKLLIL